MSAPLKAVTDRFQRYYALRFEHGVKPAVAKHKKAALIIAAGSKGEGKEEIKTMYERMFTVLNTSLEAVIFFDSTDQREPDEAAHESVKQEGEYLHLLIYNSPQSPYVFRPQDQANNHSH